MAWTLMKAAILAALPTNGANQITASDARTLLDSMVDTIGSLQMKGVAIPSTDPGPYDGERMYVALEPGTYTNFDGLVVGQNELTFLKSDGLVWTKEFITLEIDGSQLVEYDSLIDAEAALGNNKLFIASLDNEESVPHRTVMITNAAP